MSNHKGYANNSNEKNIKFKKNDSSLPLITPQYSTLTHYSPKDSVWDKNRSLAEDVSQIYSGTGDQVFDRLSSRMASCSDFLTFGWSDNKETGESALKLSKTSFCRVRHCPVCQWRRSMMWQARFYQSLPSVIEKYPNSRFVFLTLTAKNCDIEDLRNTLDHMGKSWKRFINRKQFKAVQGFIRTTEVTRSKDGQAHPHYHCLLMVRPSWFGKDYVKQSEWAEIWGSCLQIDYNPIIDIRVIKSKNGKKVLANSVDALKGAVAETLKYSVKASDMTDNPEWFLELTKQVHKLRFIATGGGLKDVLRIDEETNDDLIHGDDLSENEFERESRLSFNWRPSFRQYHRLK
jgi:plasmid rolling circle replication initiator protein Rep